MESLVYEMLALSRLHKAVRNADGHLSNAVDWTNLGGVGSIRGVSEHVQEEGLVAPAILERISRVDIMKAAEGLPGKPSIP